MWLLLFINTIFWNVITVIKTDLSLILSPNWLRSYYSRSQHNISNMHTHCCHRNMFQKLIIEEEIYRTYTVIIEICQSTNVEIEIYWTYMVTQHLLKICTQGISYCEMQRPTFALRLRLRLRSKIYRRKFILHWCKFIVHWCKFGLWWIVMDGEVHILKIYVNWV